MAATASTCSRIYLLINDGSPRNETIEFAKSASPEEIRAGLLAAAEIGGEPKGAIVKVSTKDGVLLPVSVDGLTPNSEDNRYILNVKKDSLIKNDAASAVMSPEIGTANLDLSALKATLKSLEADLDGLTEKKGQLANIPTQHTPKRAVKRVSQIDPRYMSQPKYVFTDETIKYLKTPTFDPWQWQENEMLALLEFMFVELGVVDEFKIDIPVLRKFLQAVKDGYNANPFHNFRHCFCVTQMMYGILHTTKVVEKLTPADKLILLAACVGHDLDHPGFNNAYQVNARTDLAIIYNDVSPLEMHHCAVLFTILKHPDTNIMSNIPDSTYRDIRKGIIRGILATDMAKHADLLSQMKKYADEGFKYSDAEQKSCLLQMIIKCADVSNEVRPPDVAEPWVDCLLEEFFEQADHEKAAGLPFAPFMDREKVTKAGAQVGFIGFVLIPLYELMARVLDNMDPIITPVKQALAYYKELQEKEKAAATGGK
ncbi:uncharacterized protein SPPG_02578 [Spizellomyces punctatus DAOM BR117]|uniref:Phosphodiesterase n=1 Tax=Spizellomyces punctatus (strain DAOM BR117) TaxID=645134 RepID=A0A0L0HME7_SPIPD|nr:uncharacterized protein SPPG_02578 [Spizellomyces punctatus DAOM BR117]KND02075.1 hypothetical protein SPPG_02578 [Spizellomyces punctatus DAOM BR117]|eukprot:XP_016610114.1 hypothetical protein SPPG_02578 [Spizellomyces punctatus DAOM BR117]